MDWFQPEKNQLPAGNWDPITSVRAAKPEKVKLQSVLLQTHHQNHAIQLA